MQLPEQSLEVVSAGSTALPVLPHCPYCSISTSAPFPCLLHSPIVVCCRIDVAQLLLLMVYLSLRAGIQTVLTDELYEAEEITVVTVLRVTALTAVTSGMITVFGIASLLNLFKVLRYLGLLPLLALPCLTIMNAGWPVGAFFIMSMIFQFAFSQMVLVVLSPYALEYSTLGQCLITLLIELVAGPAHGVQFDKVPPDYTWYVNLQTLVFRYLPSLLPLLLVLRCSLVRFCCVLLSPCTSSERVDRLGCRFLMYFIMMPVVIAIIAYAYGETKVPAAACRCWRDCMVLPDRIQHEGISRH